MKHVNKTNVRKTMREAWNDMEPHFHTGFADLNEHVQVGVFNGRGDEGAYATLWFWQDDIEICTKRILGCYSMTELLDYATARLMEEYEKFVEDHPWVRDECVGFV